MNRAADNPEGQDRLAAFHQGLQELGWNVGRNVRIEIRWSEDNADRTAKYAAELVALAPDIILASGTLAVTALQHLNRTLPIVFGPSLIRSAPVSSTAWLIRAATLLVS
jgi:putative ABC transport system substrate-binding protein